MHVRSVRPGRAERGAGRGAAVGQGMAAMKKLLGELSTKTANAVNTAVKTVDKALAVDGGAPHSSAVQHPGSGPSASPERYLRFAAAAAAAALASPCGGWVPRFTRPYSPPARGDLAAAAGTTT